MVATVYGHSKSVTLSGSLATSPSPPGWLHAHAVKLRVEGREGLANITFLRNANYMHLRADRTQAARFTTTRVENTIFGQLKRNQV